MQSGFLTQSSTKGPSLCVTGPHNAYLLGLLAQDGYQAK